MKVNVGYVAKWQHKEFSYYIWTECKKLINLKSGKEVKKTLKGLQAGYWINRRFTPLHSLKSQIEIIPTNPFIPFQP